VIDLDVELFACPIVAQTCGRSRDTVRVHVASGSGSDPANGGSVQAVGSKSRCYCAEMIRVRHLLKERLVDESSGIERLPIGVPERRAAGRKKNRAAGTV